LSKKQIRIGGGAGYSEDLLRPALDLMEQGNLDYIIFECLAERTIAVAQLQKLQNPDKGYNGKLEQRMKKILPLAKKHGIKVITNMGVANVEKAVEITADLARSLGLEGLKIAGVCGDDVFSSIDRHQDKAIMENGIILSEFPKELVSANAYLGYEGIAQALEQGADVVITGRCADAALVVGPLVYEFGWNSYEQLGIATSAGHLMECAGYLTGGYFANPGYSSVPDFWNVGYPICEVEADGTFYLTKLEGTGGRVDCATCTQQLLYEIGDPAKYLTPYCIADFSNIQFEEVAPNRVKVTGATGRAPTGLYKVSLGYRDGFIGTSEFSFGGLGAYERCQWAFELARKRWEMLGLSAGETRFDIIGYNSIVDGENIPKPDTATLTDLRSRISVRSGERELAQELLEEATAGLSVHAAGSGLMTIAVKEVIAVVSILIPATDPTVTVTYQET